MQQLVRYGDVGKPAHLREIQATAYDSNVLLKCIGSQLKPADSAKSQRFSRWHWSCNSPGYLLGPAPRFFQLARHLLRGVGSTYYSLDSLAYSLP